jgi:hypothetical protein
MLGARLTRRQDTPGDRQSGRSSGVEHNLAKVGVEGSNPFARSSFYTEKQAVKQSYRVAFSVYALRKITKVSAA